MHKPQFEILNGLRGVAAFSIVLFHTTGITSDYDFSILMLRHAYLAVDFFFILSGFVIGYTYDERWNRLTVKEFVVRRITRLHPLVVLGIGLGLASFVLDPFAPESQQAASPAMIWLVFLLGLLLLPSPTLPNRELATFSLNSPLWSLFLEYLANLAYALFLRRLSTRALGFAALASLASLVWMASATGKFVGGFGWDTLWVAPFRIAPPFLTGLWLARTRHRWPALTASFPVLGTALVACLLAPIFPHAAGLHLNGLYDALCIALLFPVLIIGGAHSACPPKMLAVCKTLGMLSFPLYAIHQPFLYAYANYASLAEPSPIQLRIMQGCLITFFVCLSWVAHRYWDEPIRRGIARWRKRSN